MTEPNPGPIPLLEPRDGIPPVVANPDALAGAVAKLAGGTGPVAVDAERASGYRYGQRAYLVQLRRAGSGTILIDPVAASDLSGVNAALADAEAVLHAATQDLPCLDEVGYRPQRLFDTELAGRLLGYPRVALGTLVEEVLGYHLEKGHSAADWSARPLRPELLRYAALDVELLVELRDALAAQLADQGKTEWAEQEFAAILAAEPPVPRADPWRRTSGIHRVQSRRGLAIVRELWYARDQIAQEADLSPRRVLPDAAIVEAARTPPAGHAQLLKIAGFAGRNARRHEKEWLAAVRKARTQQDSELPEPASGTQNGPPPPHRWPERDPAAAARLAAARAAITGLAEANGLPAENLLAPDIVRRLSWEPPQPADRDMIARALAGYGARPWQVRLTASQLATALQEGGLQEGGLQEGAEEAQGPEGQSSRLELSVLPGFLQSLAGPLDHYGYWAIALLLLLENIGVPVVPGELSLIAGAIFAGTGRAGLNVVVVAVVAAAVSFAGAEIGYLLGRFAGREVVLRWGKYVLIKPHHLDKAEAITDKYGGVVVIVARYIVGLREANGIIAGITGMRAVTFALFNAIGAAAWVATWVSIGALAGDHIDTVYTDVTRYALYVFGGLAVVLAGYIGYRVLRNRKRPARQGS